MNNALRLWDGGDGPTTAHRRPPTQAPVPLMRFDIEQQTGDGPHVDQILLWKNEDGMACRWCTDQPCTFMPGPAGQGNCVVRRESHQALPRSFRG